MDVLNTHSPAMVASAPKATPRKIEPSWSARTAGLGVDIKAERKALTLHVPRGNAEIFELVANELTESRKDRNQDFSLARAERRIQGGPGPAAGGFFAAL